MKMLHLCCNGATPHNESDHSSKCNTVLGTAKVAVVMPNNAASAEPSGSPKPMLKEETTRPLVDRQLQAAER